MSIFSKIKSAIFGEHGPLGGGHFGTPKAAPAPAPAPQTTAAQPAPAAPTPQAAPAAPAQAVDVEAVLSGIASKKGSDLNWRTSIVDLMKLLDLD